MFNVGKIACALLYIMTFIIVANPAQATITEAQQLTFGTWAITDNSTNHSITVQTDGSYSASSGALVMISPPQQGIYDITDLPAFTVISSVNVTMSQPMSAGGGPIFTIDNFTTNIANADENGETTLTLGARARTSGGNQPYEDDRYEGELSIEINY